MEMRRESQLKIAMGKLMKNKLAVVCFVVLILEILVVIFAPWIAPFSPEEANVSIKLAPGFWAQYGGNPVDAAKYVSGHYLGTDHMGRDVLSRIIWGGRVTLTVGFFSTFMGLFKMYPVDWTATGFQSPANRTLWFMKPSVPYS